MGKGELDTFIAVTAGLIAAEKFAFIKVGAVKGQTRIVTYVERMSETGTRCSSSSLWDGWACAGDLDAKSVGSVSDKVAAEGSHSGLRGTATLGSK